MASDKRNWGSYAGHGTRRKDRQRLHEAKCPCCRPTPRPHRHGSCGACQHRGGGQPEPAIGPEPAVPIRRSIQPDAITCLDCGRPQKMLKRHLTTAHQLTPDEYRKRWGLKSDYPMSAPNYTARRSELAKSYGLGKGGRRRVS
jgi:hypothetical protein